MAEQKLLDKYKLCNISSAVRKQCTENESNHLNILWNLAYDSRKELLNISEKTSKILTSKFKDKTNENYRVTTELSLVDQYNFEICPKCYSRDIDDDGPVWSCNICYSPLTSDATLEAIGVIENIY